MNQTVGKIQRFDKQTFIHVGSPVIRFQESCTLNAFFIFLPNSHSNAVLWNVTMWTNCPDNVNVANVACKRTNVAYTWSANVNDERELRTWTTNMNYERELRTWATNMRVCERSQWILIFVPNPHSNAVLCNVTIN